MEDPGNQAMLQMVEVEQADDSGGAASSSGSGAASSSGEWSKAMLQMVEAERSDDGDAVRTGDEDDGRGSCRSSSPAFSSCSLAGSSSSSSQMQLARADMLVTPRKLQFSIEKFFKDSPSEDECKPALDRLKAVVASNAEGFKKRGRGRPSDAEKALQAAREAGQACLVSTLEQYDAAVEAAARRLAKNQLLKPYLGGRPADVGRSSGIAAADLQSNRRRPGAAPCRVEEGAATKLQMARQMVKLKKSCSTEAEFRSSAVSLYGKQWKTLDRIMQREDEWKERVDKFRLGVGSRGTVSAKGTCCKGGRMVLKGGRGARASGGGRKNMFWHLQMQMKEWLQKERAFNHHVDKVDVYEEFVDRCVDEMEMVQKKLKILTEEAVGGEAQGGEAAKEAGGEAAK